MEKSQSSNPSSPVDVLSLMMFLQFFAWGAFFATMGAALGQNELAAFSADAYNGAPIAAIIAPLFLGLIADRLFNSEKVMAVLLIVGGIILFLVPGVGYEAKGMMQERNKIWKELGISHQVVTNSVKSKVSNFIDENGFDAATTDLEQIVMESMNEKNSGDKFQAYQAASAVDGILAAKKIGLLTEGQLKNFNDAIKNDGKKYGSQTDKMTTRLKDKELAALASKVFGIDVKEVDPKQVDIVTAAYSEHLAKIAREAANGGTSEWVRFTAEQVAEQKKKLYLSKKLDKLVDLSVNGYQKGKWITWLVLFFLLGYMPTLGLGNTIAFTHISDQNDFPKIRVWGTIGWIVAGLLVGAIGWSSSLNIFYLGGVGSLLLGAICFFLPSTPPPLKGKPLDLNSLLMVDAFKLLSDWNFFVFALCSTLICIPLAFYYGQTAPFLEQTGFLQSGSTMTIGQMSEIFFMLLIPFFFRKLGVKVMILIGMACWVLRYLMFSYGAPGQVTWMLLGAVALHGICYDFFFVTGFMYTDQKAPKEIRGQAQALLVFLTQGVGMYFGYMIMGSNITSTLTKSGDYSSALSLAKGEPQGDTSFIGQLMGMFDKGLPAELDQELLSETMSQWGTFWMYPAIFSGIVMIVFGVLFWDNNKGASSEGGEE